MHNGGGDHGLCRVLDLLDGDGGLLWAGHLREESEPGLPRYIFFFFIRLGRNEDALVGLRSSVLPRTREQGRLFIFPSCVYLPPETELLCNPLGSHTHILTLTVVVSRAVDQGQGEKETPMRDTQPIRPTRGDGLKIPHTKIVQGGDTCP